MNNEIINLFETELILEHGEWGFTPPETELLVRTAIEIVPQNKRNEITERMMLFSDTSEYFQSLVQRLSFSEYAYPELPPQSLTQKESIGITSAFLDVLDSLQREKLARRITNTSIGQSYLPDEITDGLDILEKGLPNMVRLETLAECLRDNRPLWELIDLYIDLPEDVEQGDSCPCGQILEYANENGAESIRCPSHPGVYKPEGWSKDHW